MELIYKFGCASSPSPKLAEVLSDAAGKFMNRQWGPKTVFRANTLGAVVRVFLTYCKSPFDAVHLMGKTTLKELKPATKKKKSDDKSDDDKSESSAAAEGSHNGTLTSKTIPHYFTPALEVLVSEFKKLKGVDTDAECEEHVLVMQKYANTFLDFGNIAKIQFANARYAFV